MTKEEVIERLKDIPYMDILENADYIAIARAAKMLTNATIWTPCTERMPTVEDVGEDELLNWKGEFGTVETDFYNADIEARGYIAWSRIEPIGGGNG